MKKILTLLVLVLFQCAIPVRADVNVFACEPEWAALAKQIGGDAVSTFSATTAQQDPHFIQARPSLIAKVRKSQLVFCSGADLEVGWLPLLLRKSGQRHLQPGSPGYLMATDFVRLKDKPVRIDRGQGDLHGAGNPHIHTHPRNMIPVAKVLADRLSELDPDNAALFQQSFETFQREWKQAMKVWKIKASPLRDMPIASLRNSWPYLVDWLKLKQVVILEDKPGIPPSSSHLSKVLTRVQQHPVKAVIYGASQSRRAVDWLAKRANVPALELPYTVGGNGQAVDLFSLYDNTIDLLLEANQ